MGLLSSIGDAVGSVFGGDSGSWLSSLGDISSGDWLSAGASVLGSIGGYAGQQSANASNREMAREQMAFQKMMSDTAHQREVKDLKASGLNPMLSSHGGATTPPGAMAQFGNSGAAAAEAGAHASQSANSSRLLKSQTELMAAQAQQAHTQSQLNQTTAYRQSELLPAELSKIESDRLYNLAGIRMLADQGLNYRSSSSAHNMQTRLGQARLPREITHSKLWSRGSSIVDDVMSLPESIYNFMKPNSARRAR